jgi:hypothetical protein
MKKLTVPEYPIDPVDEIEDMDEEIDCPESPIDPRKTTALN